MVGIESDLEFYKDFGASNEEAIFKSFAKETYVKQKKTQYDLTYDQEMAVRFLYGAVESIQAIDCELSELNVRAINDAIHIIRCVESHILHKQL